MSGPRKQRFLQGAAILTAGILLHKIISAFYKVPLFDLIGTESVGHFSVAYNIYEVLMSVAAAGLPVAMSRLISEAQTRGNIRQVQRVFQVSLVLFLLIGVLGGGGITLFAGPLAERMNDPEAVWAIATLGPAVLFVCLFCAFRGYFQGHQYMTPTAVSQIIEAICKLGFGLGLALLAIRVGLGSGKLAAAGILGVTIGAGASCVYLILVYLRHRPRKEIGQEEAYDSFRRTLGRVLYLAVPITLGAAGLQIFKLFGTKTILGRLQLDLGMPLEQASSLLGVYAMVLTLYMLPGALVQPVGVSVIAAATEKLTAGDDEGARRLEESALRMTALIAMPCGVGMTVLARPILRLLYSRLTDLEMQSAVPLLTLLGFASILYCVLVISNAILQAHGRVVRPLIHTLLGGTVYLILCYFLVRIGTLNILGAGLATLSYSLIIPVLNLIAVRRGDHLPPRILGQFLKPLLAALLMGLAARGCYALTHSLFAALPAAVLVYAGLVVLLRVLTWEDCMMLPKGERIARLLHIPEPDRSEDLQ